MPLASYFVGRTRSIVALLTFGALAFAAGAQASAQEASGAPSSSVVGPGTQGADTGTSGEKPAAAAAEEATPPDESAAEPPESDTVEAPAPTTASAGNRAELEKRLHELEYERAHWTNFWPWLTVGTGIGVTAIGTAVGVGAAFDCEPETRCSSPAWATLMVVAGVAISAAGTIWLVRTDLGIRELEIQTNRVRQDLEQLNYGRVVRERGFAKLGAAPFQMRLSF